MLNGVKRKRGQDKLSSQAVSPQMCHTFVADSFNE